MASDAITNLAGSLDAELEKARETLKDVDDNIKKLFGKDASELNYSGRNRLPVSFQDKFKSDDRSEDSRRSTQGRLPQLMQGNRFKSRYDDDPYEKGGPPLGDRLGPGRRLQSRIVTSTREKSREEVLAEQRDDRKGRDRNRRMFGALLGTLQRFKQEETKLKDKEDKRAQIEAKLDEAAKQERETVKLEKQQLIKNRKFKLTEIKRLEIKRRRIAELEQWEDKTKYLTNFIRTEAKPHIFFKPKILNPIMECRLEQSKQLVTEMIASKRKLVLEDLEGFEERSKRYWERRLDGHDFRRSDVDPMDQDIEYELKELMKNEELAEVTAEPDDFTVTVFHSPEKAVKQDLASNGRENLGSIMKENIETKGMEVDGNESLVEQSVNVKETDSSFEEMQE